VSVLREEIEVGPAVLVLAPGPTDVHALVEAVAAFLTGDISCVHLPVVLWHLSKSCLCAPQPFIVHGERLRAHIAISRQAQAETRRTAVGARSEALPANRYPVEFDLAQGPKGPQAENVRIS
jgi:hypothetical protein